VLLADAREGRHTHLGRLAFRETCLKALTSRLRVNAALRRHPEALRREIRRPIFVVGLQRSGTSFMHELLATGPDRRALVHWELLSPGEDDRPVAVRRGSARLGLAAQQFVAPEAMIQRPLTIDSPDECWLLFHNELAVVNLPMHQKLPGYADWLRSCDWDGVYASYRVMLQLLLHERPAEQLVLKSPDHLWTLDAMLRTFPDACVVWLHRDPSQSVASYASMCAVNRRTFSGGYEARSIGRGVLEGFVDGLERAMAARRAHGDARFHDLPYSEFVDDPVRAVEGICRRFGLPFSEDPLRRYLAARPPKKRQKHRYDAGQFGLEPAVLAERFAPYVEAHLRGERSQPDHEAP
jgi:hypothetical protein